MAEGDRSCRSCGAADQVAGVVCPACGPTVGVHAGSADALELRCVGCRQALTPGVGVRPALTCAACGGQGFGFRDAGSGWAIAPLEDLPDQTGRWVRVEFDGVYSGTDRAAAGAVHLEGRRFDVTLLEGVFSHAAYVDAPPPLASTGEAPPIREPALSGVLMFGPPDPADPAPAAHPGGPYEVTLKDFRLHGWRHVSEETPIGRTPGTHGRIRGVGYGRLDLELEQPKRRRRRRRVGAAPSAAQQLRQRATAGAERVAARMQSALPASLRDDAHAGAAQDCPVCGRIWFLLIALAFWLLCSWRAALVAGLTLWLACAVHEMLCRLGIGLHRLRPPWRTVIGLVAGLALVWLALHALQKAIAGAPLAGCGAWLFPGYGQFLLALVLCGLLPARWPRWVVTALFLWALLASCLASGRSCRAPVAAPPAEAAAAPAAPTAASTAAPGVASSGAAAPVVPPLVAPGGASLPQQLATSLSSIVSGLAGGVTALAAQDPTAQLLAGLPTGGGGLVLASVTQARNDPDRYLECWPEASAQSGPKYSIYLGYDAFFDHDSDRLKPAAAEASLRELLQVFASRPASRFVITGHADTTGTDAYNIALSRRRAQAVADWLTAHGVPAARIEVLGAGSAVPLIRPEAALDEGGYLSDAAQAALTPQFINRINRRVEVTVDCPGPKVRRRGA